MELCISADQLRAALKDLERAEQNGFHHCLAVFSSEIETSFLMSDTRARYVELWERGHPTNGALDWGRGQGVTEHNKFVNGRLIPIVE